MNIILLLIWILVVILGIANFYYNNSIIENYQNYNNPKSTNTRPNVCTFGMTPTVEQDSLTVCGDGYVYTIDGQDYKIAKQQTSYSKVCAHFCDNILRNGKCKSTVQDQKYQTCENKFKTDENCNSSIKPAVYVQDGSSKTLYYPEAPILTEGLCSTSS